MPHCPGGEADVSIYYKCHTIGVPRGKEGKNRLLLVTGLACSHEAWDFQLAALRTKVTQSPELFAEGLSVCTIDNRGIGRSTTPQHKERYSTESMAGDCLAVMAHLGWASAHVVGHSMGSMICSRLAVIASERVESLTLISTSSRFYDLLPRSARSLVLFFKMVFCTQSLEQRARVDLQCHFSAAYLEEEVPHCLAGNGSSGADACDDDSSQSSAGTSTSSTVSFVSPLDMKTRPAGGRVAQGGPFIKRKHSLKREYIQRAKVPECFQSKTGFSGQFNAVRGHKVSKKDIEVLQRSSFPLLIIHGKDDHIVPPRAGQRLFEKLKGRARLLLLHGAHFITRERANEVVESLIHQVLEGRAQAELTAMPRSPAVGSPDVGKARH